MTYESQPNTGFYSTNKISQDFTERSASASIDGDGSYRAPSYSASTGSARTVRIMCTFEDRQLLEVARFRWASLASSTRSPTLICTETLAPLELSTLASTAPLAMFVYTTTKQKRRAETAAQTPQSDNTEK